MGTRSIIEVRSRWGADGGWQTTHAVIYRHWDGYLDGHGQYIYDFLNGRRVINGISGNEKPPYANGAGQLAAQLVAQLQADGHDPDLMGSVRDCGQEYHYRIDVDMDEGGGRVSLAVFDGPMTAFGMGGESCTNLIFSGSVQEFGEFLVEEAARSEGDV